MAKKPAAKKLSPEQEREQRIAQMCDTINKGDHGGTDGKAVTYLGSREVQKLERFSCLEAIASHQKTYPDEDVALIDTEYTFDEEYAQALGINTRWLIVHQPENGDQALNVLLGLIKAGVTLIIVDSVAALTTKSDMEGNITDTQVAEQARMLSQSLRPIQAAAGQRNATIFWTNQIREKIGVTYGDKTTTPAGRALKFYTSTRCAIRRIETQKEKIDGEDVAVANLTQVDVKKNKTAPPFRKAKFYICYGRGIDPVVSTFDVAVKKGVLKKGGSWFSWPEGESIGQGRYSCLLHFQNNEEEFERLKQALADATDPKTPVADEVVVEAQEEEAPKEFKRPVKSPVEVQDV
jgi:recombination protein RecA